MPSPHARFPRSAELSGVGRPTLTAHELRAQLRTMLLQDRAFVLPGVVDAAGARLAQRAGFPAVYASGAGLANAQHGLPDLGLLTMSELVEHVARLGSAVQIPLIADVDTGFGGPLATMRTVRQLERAGAAGLQLEDQETPKRCGHFDDHRLIPTGHMQAKLAAAIEAREDDDLVIIARTDARSAAGIDDAIVRAKAYREVGADVLFVEAPRTIPELELVGRELAGIPLLVNVVEGGKTPHLTLERYEELGFKIVLHANFLLRASLLAVEQALQHLQRRGETTTYIDRIASWQGRQELVGLSAFQDAEAFYDRPWDEGGPA